MSKETVMHNRPLAGKAAERAAAVKTAQRAADDEIRRNCMVQAAALFPELSDVQERWFFTDPFLRNVLGTCEPRLIGHWYDVWLMIVPAPGGEAHIQLVTRCRCCDRFTDLSLAAGDDHVPGSWEAPLAGPADGRLLEDVRAEVDCCRPCFLLHRLQTEAAAVSGRISRWFFKEHHGATPEDVLAAHSPDDSVWSRWLFKGGPAPQPSDFEPDGLPRLG